MLHPSLWFMRWRARQQIRQRLETVTAVNELHGLPPAQFRHISQVLHLLRAELAEDSPRQRKLRASRDLSTLEESILLASYELAIRDPLSVIVYRCAQKERPDPQLAWACLCAAEWARAQGFLAVMLFFNHSAAAASESDAYYLIAELATVSADLATLPIGSNPRKTRRLHRRWFKIAEIVVAQGGIMCLSAVDIRDNLEALLPPMEPTG